MYEAEPKKRLTDLELEIMEVVWDSKPERSTVRSVVDHFHSTGRPLAYTTVQTMMNILKKKGVLSVHPGPGRAHEYEARVTRADARSSMTQDFVERLFQGHAKTLMAQLLDQESMSQDELRELKQRIETHLDDEPEEAR